MTHLALTVDIAFEITHLSLTAKETLIELAANIWLVVYLVGIVRL